MEVDKGAYIEGGTSRRMGETDLLLTTAGIAAYFAGFSSLISVIRRGSARNPRLAAFLLCFVLEVSLFAVAFSLLPLLPLEYGLAPAPACRISSFLFVVTSQLVVFDMTRRYQRSGLAAATPVTVIVIILVGGADLLLLANTFGFFGAAAFHVYLAGLFANLGLAGFCFFLLVGSIFSSRSGQAVGFFPLPSGSNANRFIFANLVQKALAGAVFLSLLVAIFSGVFLRFENLTNNGTLGSDTVYYTNIAKAWTEGNFVYQIADGRLAYRPVAYLLYAASIEMLGFHDWTLKVVNATVDSLNIGLIFVLCYLLSRRDVWLSLICATSYALLPGAILLSRIELVHVLSTFMVLTCTILFVCAFQSRGIRRRSILLFLSGIACGLAALTHEELVFCALGFGVFILVEHIIRSGLKALWILVRNTALFSAPVIPVLVTLIIVNQEQALELAAPIGEAHVLERMTAYGARLFRFTWNGIAGMSSVAIMYASLALVVAVGVDLVSRICRRKGILASAPPLDYLPLLVVVAYLTTYTYFFSTTLFERAFLPLFALLLVLLATWYHKLLTRRLTSRAAHAVLLLAAMVMIAFNLDHFPSFFGDNKRWYATALPMGFNPSRGVGAVRRWVTTTQWPRILHDELGKRVNEDARLLVASSIMYPHPGRRVLQLGYYFGDNAIYSIDHTEPFDELLTKYRVKFVVITNFRADNRVLQMKEYEAYEYHGRWSKPRPLRLGASYGFEPGEYSLEGEIRFVLAHLAARGARLISSSRHSQLYEL